MNWRNRHPSGPKPNIVGTAIVARGTIAGNAHVPERRRSERGNRVANVTILIRRQVARCLN